jgi:hypothetical protein
MQRDIDRLWSRLHPWRLLHVCAVIIGAGFISSATASEAVLLVDPAAALEQTWTHQRFEGETDYERVRLDGIEAIRAVGRDSASGLYREVQLKVSDHPWLASDGRHPH